MAALVKVLDDVASLTHSEVVGPILSLLQCPPPPKANYQAAELSPPALLRPPGSHHISDGIESPTLLHMALERFFDNSYTPPMGVEDFLCSLPINNLWDPVGPSRLLCDFESHELLCVPLATLGGLAREDRLAVYAYTYELKHPARQDLCLLKGEALKAHVSDLLAQTGLPPFSSGFWDAKPWAGEIFLCADAQQAQCLTFDPKDAEALQRLNQWLRSPDSERSSPLQLYREMNAAMRMFEASRDAVVPYLPLIHRMQAALSKLPTCANAAKSDGQHYLIVYRGIDVEVSPALYRPGNTICWPAFSSTSSSVEVAKSFLGGKSTGTLFIVEALTARDVSWLSQFPSEAEYLLPPQSLFRVKGHASVGLRQILGVPDGVHIIELRQLREDETQVEFLMAEAGRTYKKLQKAEATRKYAAAWQRYPHTAIGCFCQGMALAWDKAGVLKPPEEPLDAYLARMKEECLTWFVRALEKESSHPLLLAHYAFALHRRGDNASAKLNFIRALQVDPGLTDGYHGLALVAFHTKDFDALQRIAPLYIRCVMNDGAAFIKRGDIAAARGGLQRVYLADPCHAEANAILVTFHRQLGEMEDLEVLCQAQAQRQEGSLHPDPYCQRVVESNRIADNPFWLYHCLLHPSDLV
eukprot:GGOE01018460.1.p1 GENE.GGOE01018460.1~~GGOE01018460.1.p1  ORF type:complete len:717 (-),score=193.20 GGOE01018460.1:193-2112(-)